MKPVFIDGAIYVGIAFVQIVVATLGTDDAAKYIDPKTLFYVRHSFEALGGSLLAFKLYRSTAYADHQKEKKETSQWTKETPKP